MALWLWLPLLALALAPPLAPPPALAVSIGQTAGSSPSPGSPGDVASAATPTIVPMTIPLPDPVFWDPSTSRENYVVVEQGGSLHLIRAKTGQVIGRFERKTHGEGIPLGLQLPEQIRKMAGDAPSLPPVRGWPFHPGGAVERTPLLVDLDGDCIAEVLFATPDGWLWALGPDALVLAGWPVPLGAACDAALGAADLDRDGYPEVLAGDVEGKVHALRRDGTSLEGWPARVPGTTALPAISGAVTAADLDGDGWTEVIVTQAAGRVCVLLSDGQAAAGWPVSTAAGDDPPNAGTIFSRPAIGDLDGDSRLEIVAGANNYRAHAWDLHGRPLRGWPRLFENRGRAGYADPVLADLDSDRLPEVILATDRGFSGPSRLYVLDRKGQDLAGWPVDLPEACNSGCLLYT
ncbi:MAG: VCBS repeat-containing protein, partial [Candidatus Eisenbacteria bacterium]|nr:VCBS repeat-containing protein [Candidatus Eisenbacteria bacterium]